MRAPLPDPDRSTASTAPAAPTALNSQAVLAVGNNTDNRDSTCAGGRASNSGVALIVTGVGGAANSRSASGAASEPSETPGANDSLGGRHSPEGVWNAHFLEYKNIHSMFTRATL